MCALGSLARAATWTPGPGTIAQRSGHAMAYDSARGRIVLYGGTCAETWEFDGTGWKPGPDPPAGLATRRFHAMAYDSLRQVAVLFGGFSGASVKNDTWEWNGATWTLGPAAPAGLAPRQQHAMAYDQSAGKTVLFGGIDGGNVKRNDTWLYDGISWQAGPAAPLLLTPRQGHAMAYAGPTGTVLFGGFGCTGAPCNDTWIWNGTAWSAGPPPAAGLVPRQGHALAYDATRAAVVLFGGFDQLGNLRNDTFELRSGAWLAGPGAPAGLAPRQQHATAFDQARGRIVMFGGGGTGQTFNDTWLYDGSSWTGLPNAIPTARAGHATVYDEARKRVVLFGGTEGGGGLKNDTWEYDGSTWTPGPSAPAGLAPRQQHAMAYGSAAIGVVLFGGSDGATARNDLWKYDGIAWTAGPAAPPGLAAREACAMGYLGSRGVVVLFGGLDATSTLRNDTWEFDGTAWTPGGGPPPGLAPRQQHAMSYDAPRQRIVLFGGRTAAGPQNDTWEYGGGWTPGPAPPPGLAPRQQHAIAYDSVRGRTILYGGGDGSASFDDTWEYDGSGWAAGGIVPSELTPRLAHASTYDTQRGRVVMFGGVLGGCFFAETWEYGTEDYLVGEGLGPNNANGVRAFASDGTPTVVDFLAYGAGAWGTNVSSAELNGDNFREILTGPGPGTTLGPQVRGFRKDASVIAKVNYFAYGTLKYGANVAAADTDRDGYGEIVTGAGPGDVFGPHVRGFNFDNAAIQAIAKVNFFAYGTLKYGVNVTGGDVEGDGYGELLTGPGPGIPFGPQVRGFNVDGGFATSIAKINFNALGTTQYGVNVAGGDVDADLMAEIAATPGPGPSYGSQFVGFNHDGGPIAPLPGFGVTPFVTKYGGRVGLGDVGASSADDLIACAGRDPAADSTVRPHAYTGSALVALAPTFVAFPGTTHGVNGAAGELGY